MHKYLEMFKQTLKEIYNDLGDDGFDGNIDEYVLRELLRRNRPRPEAATAAEAPAPPEAPAPMEMEPPEDIRYEEYMKWEDIEKITREPGRPMIRLAIPVPRGTSEVTKKKLLDYKERLSTTVKQMRALRDQVTKLQQEKVRTAQQALDAKTALHQLNHQFETERRNWDNTLQQYESKLADVLNRESYYKTELRINEKQYREDKQFWTEAETNYRNEIGNLQAAVANQRDKFLTAYQEQWATISGLQWRINQQDSYIEQLDNHYRRLIQDERQQTEHQLQIEQQQSRSHILTQEQQINNLNNLIQQQVNQLNEQDRILNEQQAELTASRNEVRYLHEEMTQATSALEEMGQSSTTQEGGTFMRGNWLDIAGYRNPIGNMQQILWDNATLTEHGKHYADRLLENSYWVNWVKSNKLDQLALKYGLIKKGGGGFISYKSHDDRPDIISGRTAYNTIMQFRDLTLITINATEKVKNGQSLENYERKALQKAGNIFAAEGQYYDDDPKLLTDLKRAYDNYLMTIRAIENERQTLM